FGCSVTMNGDGSGGPAVSVTADATAKLWSTGLGGRSTNIFIMDLHGSKRDVCVPIGSSKGFTHYIGNECTGTCGTDANTVGIKVIGNNNTVHNGEATGNTGDGVQVNGNGNVIDTTDATKNGGKGFNVVGDTNTVNPRKVGDKNAGNGGDGIYVNGIGN